MRYLPIKLGQSLVPKSHRDFGFVTDVAESQQRRVEEKREQVPFDLQETKEYTEIYRM